jgi:hypothetical protein
MMRIMSNNGKENRLFVFKAETQKLKGMHSSDKYMKDFRAIKCGFIDHDI